ncbi:MAG: flagellar basal body L-ring protein FlgH [Candidatus Omnitrophica bacterium]|nr:flagellar basal body L-ring protein FlgH [Candidatus Omnitrophota bacterium]
MKRIVLLLIIFLFLGKFIFADSLWKRGEINQAKASLYTDQKASQIGDIITIIIVETASANQKASSSTSRDSNIKGEVKDWFNLDFYHGEVKTDIPKSTGLPKWEIDTANKFSGSGTYSGNYSVKGQITTRVIDVLVNGNLVVEGESQVKINEEINKIAISGIVRPEDIGPNNTILSTQLADAKVHIIGKGPLNDKTKRGLVGRILDWVWPF